MPPITSTNDTDGPPNAPRLCHMVLVADFKGYGFNLHTTKEKPGQYIGQVDDDSPAFYAKLKKRDRIVEVNGVNISNENHKQVVARIKAVDNETRLLVVDDSCDSWYKSNNIVISSSMAGVEHCSSVRRRESDVSSDHKASGDRGSIASDGSGSSSNSEASPQKEKEDSDSESDIEESATEVKDTEELRKHSLASSTKSDDEKDTSDDEKDASDDEKDASDDEKDASDDEKDASDDEKDDSVEVKVNSDKESVASDVEREDSVKERDSSSDEEDAKSEMSEVVEVAKITESVVETDRKSTTDSEKSGSIHLASEQADKNDVKDVTEIDSGNAVERKESISSASSRGSGANTGSTERAAEDKTPSSVSPSPPSSFGSPSPTPQQAPPPKSFNIPGLNMNMSVAEMRAHLASKKKKDIRHEGIDMRKKYEMIQKL